ncbi:MAG: SPOR domain-containing protein [Bacteroidales bacterium]|nr:SPOR domain-containing protein [Bacteroidales bacterium]
MNKLILVLIFIIVNLSMFAQDQTKNFSELFYLQDTLGNTIANNGGDVTIFQDARLEQLMYNYSKAFKRQPQKTWRVQIYFGTGRNGRASAQSIRNNFEVDHPGVPTYLIFEEPYFKVRVGDFDNKIDAERLKMQLIEDYSQLFIVEDTD